MRNVTPELAAAIEAAEQHCQPTLSVDWDGDGHGTALVTDTFQRTLSTRWGHTPTGELWLHTGLAANPRTTDFAITPGAATHTVTGASAMRISYIQVNRRQVRVVATGNTCPLPTGATLEPANLLLRMTTTSTYYMCRPIVSTSGAVTLTIRRLNLGTETLLGSAAVAGYTHAAATPFSVAAECETNAAGNVDVRFKIWQGPTEPGAWQLTVTDSSTDRLLTAGWVGIRDGREAGNTNTNPAFVHGGFTASNLVTADIDNLSGRLENLTIERDFSGSLPDDVLVVEGTAAAEASGSLVVGQADDERLDAVRYFSRFNPASPLYGKPRTDRDTRIAVQYATTAGPQTVPRLTNAVLRALPVDVAAKQADLVALDLRGRLRTAAGLPAIAADIPYLPTITGARKPGLEATFIASWCLWKAGYPLSPPPIRPDRACIWVPYHGSAAPVTAYPHTGSPIAATVTVGDDDWENGTVCTFDQGPFSLGLARPPAGKWHRTILHPAAGFPAMFFGDGRSAGRIELWVKPRPTPSERPFTVTTATYSGTTATSATFEMTTGGQLRLLLTNGAVTRTILGPTIAVDDTWHQVGVTWSDADGRAVFVADTAPTVTTFTATPTTTGGTSLWSATGSYADPVAELVISAGTTELTNWQPYTHPAVAVCDRLQNRNLHGIVPADDDTVWSVLDELVQAELGLLHIDVDGRPCVWSRARLLGEDALIPVRTVTARAHLTDLAYTDDQSMIRNVVTVTPEPVTVTINKRVWTLEKTTVLPPLTSITIPIKFPPVTSAGQTDTSPGSGLRIVGYANTAADGTGFQTTFGTSPPAPTGIDVTVERLTATTANLVLGNRYYQQMFLLELLGEPALSAYGDVLERAAADVPSTFRDASASVRELPLDVSGNRWLQDDPLARGIAAGLCALLRDEQVVFTDLTFPGDPRLEPYDRIRVQDPDGLVLDTDLTLEGISDKFPGVGYDTTAVARPAREQWLLGGAGVGTALGSTLVGGTFTPADPDPDPVEELLDVATLLVAASDASPSLIALADYVCDGTADDVQIQQAVDAAKTAGGMKVLLSPGNFAISAPINLDGVDDVDIEYEHRLHGCGESNTTLNVAAGISAGIRIRDCARVQVENLGLTIDGSTDGIQTIAGSAAGGYRSAWLSSFKHIQVKGPFDGGDTGWAFDFDNLFRSVIENIEINGTTNGIRLRNSNANFNAGDCTFNRVFVDLGNGGNGGVAYHLESTAGNMNQVTFITCHSIANAGATGTVAWKFSGSGNTSHARLINCNVEQFATSCEIANTASDIDVDFVHVTQRNGSTLFDVAGYNCLLRVGLCYIEPSATATVINDSNSYALKPNVYERVDGYVDTGGTANATLGSTAVLRDSVWDGATVAAALRKPPGVAQSKAVTLTDAATIATDASLGNYFRVTLGGNRTLGAPTNPVDGQVAHWEFRQDATGSRTITLNAVFVLATGLSSTLTTTANRYDVMTAVYNSAAAKWWITSFAKNLA